MKTIKLLQLVLLSSILFSCTTSDPVLPVLNNFTVNGANFATPHAYLILDNGPVFNDEFGLAFSNAPLLQDGTNGFGAATSMTQATVLFAKNSPASFTNEQLVQVAATTHTLDSSNSAVLTNVTNFTNTFVNGGTTYGQPSQTNASIYEIQTGGNGTITINSINIDYFTRTGLISCTYQMTTSSGVIITGNYSGVVHLLNGF